MRAPNRSVMTSDEACEVSHYLHPPAFVRVATRLLANGASGNHELNHLEKK